MQHHKPVKIRRRHRHHLPSNSPSHNRSTSVSNSAPIRSRNPTQLQRQKSHPPSPQPSKSRKPFTPSVNSGPMPSEVFARNDASGDSPTRRRRRQRSQTQPNRCQSTNRRRARNPPHYIGISRSPMRTASMPAAASIRLIISTNTRLRIRLA